MTGIELRVSMDRGLAKLLTENNLQNSEVLTLMGNLPQVCREQCTLSLPEYDRPILDLWAIDSFLPQFEQTLLDAVKVEAPDSDFRVSVMCFHMPAKNEPDIAVIEFFLFCTHDKSPEPDTRVVCPVYNIITYH